MSGTYTPNPADATQPVEAVIAETAAAEFRALKGRVNNVTANAALQNGSGLQNILINGDFSINNQQGINEFTPPTTSIISYVTEMWNVGSIAANINSVSAQTFIEQIDGPPGYTTYERFKVKVPFPATAAGEYYEVCQYIEGVNFRHMNFGSVNARPSTVLFFARCSVANRTLAATLRSANNTRSYIMPFTTGAANTWQRYAFNLPGDTTGTWLAGVTESAQITFTLSASSTFFGAANTWLAGNRIATAGITNFTGAAVNSTFDVTGVEWRPGTYNVQNPIEIVPHSISILMCSRYFQTDAIGLAVGQTGWVSFQGGMRRQPIITSIPAGLSPGSLTSRSASLANVSGVQQTFNWFADARLEIT